MMESSRLKPPTSRLPPIAKIKSTRTDELANSLSYLRSLYNPDVRGSRLQSRQRIYPPGHNTSETEWDFGRRNQEDTSQPLSSSETLLDALRSDEFEKAYSIRWLTTLVSHSDRFVDTLNENLDLEDQQVILDWENLIRDAAALLAVCAGAASAGVVSRTFIFHRPVGKDVRVQVTDLPIQNSDFTTVGAQTWGSACTLSKLIVTSPTEFGLHTVGRINPVRILELGAGTGLVSLTVGKIFLEDTFSSVFSTLVSTDFNPVVLENLRSNIDANFPPASQRGPPSRLQLLVSLLDWETFPSSPILPLFDDGFDIIFGADVIYEPKQAEWIKNCLPKLLRKPDGGPRDPCFHLMIPLRPTHTAESQAIENLFPFTHTVHDPNHDTLAILSKDILCCEANETVHWKASGAMTYIHYAIAWC